MNGELSTLRTAQKRQDHEYLHFVLELFEYRGYGFQVLPLASGDLKQLLSQYATRRAQCQSVSALGAGGSTCNIVRAGGSGKIAPSVSGVCAPVTGLQTGLFPPHVAARYMEQILRALQFLHQCKIMHTDLKPDNIFYAPPPPGLTPAPSAAVVPPPHRAPPSLGINPERPSASFAQGIQTSTGSSGVSTTTASKLTSASAHNGHRQVPQMSSARSFSSAATATANGSTSHPSRQIANALPSAAPHAAAALQRRFFEDRVDDLQIARQNVEKAAQKAMQTRMDAQEKSRYTSSLKDSPDTSSRGAPLQPEKATASSSHMTNNGVLSSALVEDMDNSDPESARHAARPTLPGSGTGAVTTSFFGNSKASVDQIPESLLLSYILKVSDFGECVVDAPLTKKDARPQKRLGDFQAPIYRAPESWMKEWPLGPQMDWWGAGIIFHDMLSGKPLFPLASDARILYENALRRRHALQEQQELSAIDCKNDHQIFQKQNRNGKSHDDDQVEQVLSSGVKEQIERGEPDLDADLFAVPLHSSRISGTGRFRERGITIANRHKAEAREEILMALYREHLMSFSSQQPLPTTFIALRESIRRTYNGDAVLRKLDVKMETERNDNHKLNMAKISIKDMVGTLGPFPCTFIKRCIYAANESPELEEASSNPHRRKSTPEALRHFKVIPEDTHSGEEAKEKVQLKIYRPISQNYYLRDDEAACDQDELFRKNMLPGGQSALRTILESRGVRISMPDDQFVKRLQGRAASDLRKQLFSPCAENHEEAAGSTLLGGPPDDEGRTPSDQSGDHQTAAAGATAASNAMSNATTTGMGQINITNEESRDNSSKNRDEQRSSSTTTPGAQLPQGLINKRGRESASSSSSSSSSGGSSSSSSDGNSESESDDAKKKRANTDANSQKTTTSARRVENKQGDEAEVAANEHLATGAACKQRKQVQDAAHEDSQNQPLENKKSGNNAEVPSGETLNLMKNPATPASSTPGLTATTDAPNSTTGVATTTNGYAVLNDCGSDIEEAEHQPGCVGNTSKVVLAEQHDHQQKNFGNPLRLQASRQEEHAVERKNSSEDVLSNKKREVDGSDINSVTPSPAALVTDPNRSPPPSELRTILSEKVSREVDCLMRQLLTIDPQQRCSPSAALNHPFFKTMRILRPDAFHDASDFENSALSVVLKINFFTSTTRIYHRATPSNAIKLILLLEPVLRFYIYHAC
ncbi:unnamed protein product [Amoebophrya sp. A25]|nr:unnamed protein product [Amoebophrya sp. A25]|eukprot:GSA25T00002015001.1